MSTTASALSRRQIASWRNAVFVTFALNGLGMATWVARTPAIRDHLGIGSGEVGLLLLGVSSGSIVGLLFSSHVLTWLGAKRTVLYCLTMCAIGLVVMGVGASVFESYVLTLLGLFLYGLGTGMCDVAMNVEGAAAERAAGRTLMPLFHAMWSVGTIVGAGIGSLVSLAHVPVAVHLSAVAVVLAGGAVFAIRAFLGDIVDIHDEHGEPAPKSTFRDRVSIWLEPRTLLIGAIVLGMAFTEGSANDWLALAMVDERGVSHATGAALFGVFTVAMTVARVAGVPLLDRYGRVPVLRGSAALAVIGLALVIFVEQPVVMVIGIVFWGLGAALGFPVGMSAAADDPAKAAARVSAVATVGYCAFLVGPPLIGIVGEQVGLLNALLFVLVLIVIAGVLSPAARERSTTPQPVTDARR